jgi:hypothetical protein
MLLLKHRTVTYASNLKALLYAIIIINKDNSDENAVHEMATLSANH